MGQGDLTLAGREWRCERCSAINQRDLNAAQNIKDEAIRQISGVPGVASSARKFACGARSLARWRQRVKLPAGKQEHMAGLNVPRHFLTHVSSIKG